MNKFSDKIPENATKVHLLWHPDDTGIGVVEFTTIYHQIEDGIFQLFDDKMILVFETDDLTSVDNIIAWY
jgi:hypothetical protein